METIIQYTITTLKTSRSKSPYKRFCFLFPSLHVTFPSYYKSILLIFFLWAFPDHSLNHEKHLQSSDIVSTFYLKLFGKSSSNNFFHPLFGSTKQKVTTHLRPKREGKRSLMKELRCRRVPVLHVEAISGLVPGSAHRSIAFFIKMLPPRDSSC